VGRSLGSGLRGFKESLTGETPEAGALPRPMVESAQDPARDRAAR
jgi:hypothetical protein